LIRKVGKDELDGTELLDANLIFGDEHLKVGEERTARQS
jgi:hypothetical protein